MSSLLRPLLSSSLRFRLSGPLSTTSQVHTSAVAAAVAKKAKGGQVQRKKTFDVVTDTKLLATHLCGSNYYLEGEDIELAPKESYPEWLWTVDVNRPKPGSEGLEPGTKDYFLALREEAYKRHKTISKGKRFVKNKFAQRDFYEEF